MANGKVSNRSIGDDNKDGDRKKEDAQLEMNEINGENPSESAKKSTKEDK